MFEKLVKSELKVDVTPEFKFHPVRKWRADFAIPEHRILIEVEGGVWNYGRHNRAAGFIKDMDKYNSATSMGWSILRVQPKDLMSQATLDLIKETIKNK
jgi:very-short-patch-repair endonuclease